MDEGFVLNEDNADSFSHSIKEILKEIIVLLGSRLDLSIAVSINSLKFGVK